MAVVIARNNPATPAALRTLLDATPKSPRNLGDAILQALSSPLPDEADTPLARGDDRDKKQLRAMQDAVSLVALELGMPEGLLASRRWLETLQDGADWPGALSGWRRTLLEPTLAPFLAAGGSSLAANWIIVALLLRVSDGVRSQPGVVVGP